MLKACFFFLFCFTQFLQSTSLLRLLIDSKQGAYALDYRIGPNPKLLFGSASNLERPIHVQNCKDYHHHHHHHHGHAEKAFHQSMAEAPINYEQHHRQQRHHHNHRSTRHKRAPRQTMVPDDAFQFSSRYFAEAPAPSRHHHHHHHHHYHHRHHHKRRRHRHKRFDSHASDLLQVPRFPYQYTADAPAPAPDQHHHHNHHHRRQHRRSPTSKPKESPWLLSKIFSAFWP
ncbi:hypothetical protein RND81_04G128800 [Saponaria officinalis]|uniref:Histidine-rich glycoprotein n=1 Tax=Saponaria officinalis TaxID=3572 RepID=A0AAW1LNJ5_SAPOF